MCRRPSVLMDGIPSDAQAFLLCLRLTFALLCCAMRMHFFAPSFQGESRKKLRRSAQNFPRLRTGLFGLLFEYYPTDFFRR